MSATATGIGRLLNWERFAVGLRSSVVGGVGFWDSDGRWRAYDDDYREVEGRSDVWAIVGFGRRWSLYGRLPWVISYRHVGNLGDSVGGGLADVQAGARFEVFGIGIGIGEYLWVPALALTAMVGFPTGRSVETSNAGGSDITSRGAWALSFGATIEKTHLPLSVRLALGGNVPLPKQRDDLGKSQRYGVGLQSELTGGALCVRLVVASVFGRDFGPFACGAAGIVPVLRPRPTQRRTDSPVAPIALPAASCDIPAATRVNTCSRCSGVYRLPWLPFFFVLFDLRLTNAPSRAPRAPSRSAVRLRIFRASSRLDVGSRYSYLPPPTGGHSRWLPADRTWTNRPRRW